MDGDRDGWNVSATNWMVGCISFANRSKRMVLLLGPVFILDGNEECMEGGRIFLFIFYTYIFFELAQWALSESRWRLSLYIGISSL